MAIRSLIVLVLSSSSSLLRVSAMAEGFTGSLHPVPDTVGLLTARKLLQEKAIAIENDLRGLLRNFGLKVGMTGTVRFEVRVQELVDGMPELADIIASLRRSCGRSCPGFIDC